MSGYFCIWFIDFMLAGKTLIDYTSLFAPYDFKKMTIKFWVILKTIKVFTTCLNFSKQTQYILNEINKIKIYFTTEIKRNNQ